MSERNIELALNVPADRLDELPFGGVLIDEAGTILEYNEYETRLSHLQRERVLGLNFFHDVAPCTAVKAFEGRMREFLKTKDRVSESFAYRFPFMHGAVDVEITFVRMPEKGRVLIAIEQVSRRA